MSFPSFLPLIYPGRALRGFFIDINAGCFLFEIGGRGLYFGFGNYLPPKHYTIKQKQQKGNNIQNITIQNRSVDPILVASKLY